MGLRGSIDMVHVLLGGVGEGPRLGTTYQREQLLFCALCNRVLRTVPSEERLFGDLFKSSKATALK